MDGGNRTIIRVDQRGRIVIPASIRKSLGLDVGAKIFLSVEGDHATLMSAKTARRKACERVCRYIPPNVSLSEELMAERKAEARLLSRQTKR